LSQRIDHITFLQCGYRMKQTLGQNSVEELVSPYTLTSVDFALPLI